jgi:hypothetical protein
MKILKLANNAYSQYVKQNSSEKQKLLNYVLLNCSLKDGKLTPTYRQPFDLIAISVAQEKIKRAKYSTDSALNNIWRGRRDLNSRPPA